MLKNVLSVDVVEDCVEEVSAGVSIDEAGPSIKQKKKKLKRKLLDTYLNKGLDFNCDDEEYIISRVKACTDLVSAENIYYKVLEYEGKIHQMYFQNLTGKMKFIMQEMYNDKYEAKVKRVERKKSKKPLRRREKVKECGTPDPSIGDSLDLEITGPVSDSASDISKNATLVSDFFKENKKGTNIISKDN